MGEDDDLSRTSRPAQAPQTRMLGAVILGVALGAAGGGAWWLLGDGVLPSPARLAALDPNRVILDIPPRPGEPPVPPRGASDTPGAPNTLNSLAGASEGAGAGVVVPPVRLAAFADLPLPPPSPPLVPAPDTGLVEQSPPGPLPRIAADGRLAGQVYARPFPPATAPRIAVIMTGLGLGREATQGAIQYLPASVSLAFDPYASGLQSGWPRPPLGTRCC